MNKRRLLKLADLLEADAKDRKGICFDFSIWGEVEDEKKPISCGTTACALGLAALSGAFKRAGLGYLVAGGALNFTFGGEGCGSLTAAARTFDISTDDAHNLFLAQDDLKTLIGSRAERAIAKRIRDFVTGDRS